MKMLRFLMLLLILLQLGKNLTTAHNYCHNSSHVCNRRGLKHFICEENPRPYLNKTKYVATVPDTYRLRHIILAYCNKCRNELAGGYLTTLNNKTFKPAARMRELVWDLELAYTARLHAESVSFKHSTCRSVLRFPYAGESMYLVAPTGERRSISNILDETIRNAFETYKDIKDPDRLISNFQVPEDIEDADFTMLINDRVSRVGCAIVIATDCHIDDRKGYCYLITCHYDFLNLVNSYTYLTGNASSRCSDWKSYPSRSYRNLCHNSGKLIPQPDIH